MLFMRLVKPQKKSGLHWLLSFPRYTFAHYLNPHAANAANLGRLNDVYAYQDPGKSARAIVWALMVTDGRGRFMRERLYYSSRKIGLF